MEHTIDLPDLSVHYAKPLREALQKHGLWTHHQAGARRWAIGCVSLEVTQRCNLDCSLCYLSEHSESIADYPLTELMRRIDLIAAQYGPNTDIQISGGDPTLRPLPDLIAIVQYIRQRGMRCSLFTNGILATRSMLSVLAQAGLSDVAFHVDLTQERAGYATESDLNSIRLEYIERARGLGISVMFNTTIFQDNLHDVPMLAKFFAQHSDLVRLVSFQMQAATGRGVLGQRVDAITQQNVMKLIEQGAGTSLNFDALIGGHPSCNRYATAITLGRGKFQRNHDLFRDGSKIATIMRETSDITIGRTKPLATAWQVIRAILSRPRTARVGLQVAARWLWHAAPDLPRALGGVGKISFFIHNFMDASELDQERIETCVFMAASAIGPIPMCEFNARRDAFLLQPSEGSLAPQELARVYPIKFLKGKSRRIAMIERSKNKMQESQQ